VSVTEKPEETLQEILVGLIDEPEGRVRMSIDPAEVDDLAESIKAVGLVQPIIVRKRDGRFEVVAGHRRYLAYRQCGYTAIPCIVRELDDLQCALMRASENLPRVDLTVIEEAAIYQDLIENHGLRLEDIARRMGKSEGVIKRRLALLEMPPCVQQALHRKAINYGVAEELVRLGRLADVEYYLGFAIDHGATVAVVRGWVNDHLRTERGRGHDVEGTQGVRSPMQAQKVYATCPTCEGPLEIGTETVFRVCPDCARRIAEGMGIKLEH
jgi:ParB/RepB/Spo0J family partition protein